MKAFIALTVLALVVAVSPARAYDRETLAGRFEIARGGKPKVNGATITLPSLRSGGQPIVSEERLHFLSESDNQRFALLSFWGKTATDVNSSTHFVVVEFLIHGVRVSNAIATGLEVQWGDNNFGFADGDLLRFGVFAPKRIQYVYHNGKLLEDTGYWKGPKAPENYIEPDKSLPCANVANVPECLAEVERAEAASRKEKPSKAPHGVRSTIYPGKSASAPR
jgi:hypothetical protein